MTLIKTIYKWGMDDGKPLVEIVVFGKAVIGCYPGRGEAYLRRDKALLEAEAEVYNRTLERHPEFIAEAMASGMMGETFLDRAGVGRLLRYFKRTEDGRKANCENVEDVLRITGVLKFEKSSVVDN